LLSLSVLLLAAALATLPTPVARAQDPISAAERNAAGLELWHDYELDAAIDVLSQAIAVRPDWLPPYNHRALARAAAGDYEIALADAEIAVDLIPTLPLSDSERASVLDTRAYIYLLLERWSEALADYDAVMDATPDTRPAYALGRGLTLLQLGDTRRGMDDVKWGFLIAPSYRSNPQTEDLLDRAHVVLLDLMPEHDPDAYEPDDSPEQPRPLALNAESQVRSLHTAGDVDWVSLELQAGQRLALFTNSPTCDTYLTLYGPDARTVLREDDDGGVYRDSVIELTITQAGTYYASVRHFFPEGTCASYRIGAAARALR
jgi:tetratricopeptide (TPR) repeat protein